MPDRTTRFYRHLAQTSNFPMGLEVDRAEGCWIYTTNGDRYVDLISGIAVSSLGHRHPEVIKAIQQQIDRHLHVMVYGEFVQQPQVDLVTLLSEQLPESLSQIYLVNSGTEAVEGALKLAKKSTGRSGLISFKNSYHGDTHGSLSVTGREIYRDPYRPLLPDVTFLEFNDSAVPEAINNKTAAVILEPIKGEGGIIEADQQWLSAVRKACDQTGACLIFDEIQTGFFRTGDLFAFKGYNVTPDILCMAKAMGGGMPIGAFASSPERFRAFKENPPLSHVTTFGGHPVSAAAAHASLVELLRDDFGKRSRRIGEIAKEMLAGRGIQELRGRGGMLGLQLANATVTREVVEYCLRRGVILGWTLHSDTLIRLAPPLTIDEDVLRDSFCTILDGIGKALES